jgi:hypothetical protein
MYEVSLCTPQERIRFSGSAVTDLLGENSDDFTLLKEIPSWSPPGNLGPLQFFSALIAIGQSRVPKTIERPRLATGYVIDFDEKWMRGGAGGEAFWAPVTSSHSPTLPIATRSCKR